MALMCEECKCSIFNSDSGCENGCGCCNREGINELLATRTAQLLAITDEQRDEYLDGESDDNPILHAETGPNRFASMSLFFTDSDGVRIEEDINCNEIEVYYFTDETEQQLTDGPIYDWALNYYQTSY